MNKELKLKILRFDEAESSLLTLEQITGMSSTQYNVLLRNMREQILQEVKDYICNFPNMDPSKVVVIELPDVRYNTVSTKFLYGDRNLTITDDDFGWSIREKHELL